MPWTYDDCLLIGPFITTFNEFVIKIPQFLPNKLSFKMSSANFLPFCTGGIISSIVCFPFEFVFAFRADFRLAPSQWETSLQSNDVSHRLGANLELALTFILLTWLPPPFRSPSERGLQGSVHRRHQIGRVSCATPSWGHQHVSQWEEGLFRVFELITG